MQMTDLVPAPSYDAVVVGSGIGGSTFALGLAKRGLRIAVLERGDFLRPDAPTGEPVHNHYFAGRRVIGGNSKSFGAAMYRLREVDFAATQHECGVSPAWPISYADLEPFYCEAEQIYKVHGSSVNDPSEPPRSNPWPYPAIPHQGPVRELVRRIEERAGIAVTFIPRAVDYDPAHGGRCVLCRHCDAYYCPRDAKMDAEVAALVPAIQSGQVTVFTNSDCLRILTTPDGKRVTGVQAKVGGREFIINAGIVSASCGLRDSPLLLWRSRTTQHPKGLANGSGALGRYWTAHTHAWLFPLSIGVQKHPFHQKTFAINAFNKPGWGSNYPLGVIQSAGNIDPIGMSRRYRYPAQVLVKHSFQTFAMAEALPTRDSGFALTDDGLREIGKPVGNPGTFSKLRKQGVEMFRAAGYRVFAPGREELFHSVGTARMGSDPSDSVINADCMTHDIEGLFVVDSSSLPTSGVLNSGLTIAAVALRAAANARLP